jgi:hypothetical protein
LILAGGVVFGALALLLLALGPFVGFAFAAPAVVFNIVMAAACWRMARRRSERRATADKGATRTP